MEKKISLKIPERTLKNLVSISDFYNQDIDQTIIGILNAIGKKSSSIIAQGKEKKRSVEFEKILVDLLQAGGLSADFFRMIPKELGSEDLFVLEDFDFCLEEDRLSIHYAATQKSALWITNFALEIIHSNYTLSCDSYVNIEKVSPEVLDSLEENANMCFEELDPKH